MKKLIVIAAVALATIATQAASFSWKTSATGKVYEAGTTTLLASGTAYLFDANTMSQALLLESFVGGTMDLATKSIANTSITAGAFTGAAFDYANVAVGGTLSAYVAILSNDMLFLSDANSTVGVEGKTAALPNFSLKTASQAVAMDATKGYSAAGWYESVPEPTSGLLLLLGMAGLALKRKHA